MISVVLYILSFLTFLIIIYTYRPREEYDDDETVCATDAKPNNVFAEKINRSKILAVLGLGSPKPVERFDVIPDCYFNLDELFSAFKQVQLDQFGTVFGIDFTASNEWQGNRCFNGNSLHKVSASTRLFNRYQKVLFYLSDILKPYTDETRIYAYGFGDLHSKGCGLMAFMEDEVPCSSFDEVLERYTSFAKRLTLSGPTSFAPLIYKAINLVTRLSCYHVLFIVTDGHMKENEIAESGAAIIEASNYPLSIIIIGVGDGPWETMENLDYSLPRRRFDNLHFVNFEKYFMKAKSPECSLNLHVLMKLPEQYAKIKKLGYMNAWKAHTD